MEGFKRKFELYMHGIGSIHNYHEFIEIFTKMLLNILHSLRNEVYVFKSLLNLCDKELLLDLIFEPPLFRLLRNRRFKVVVWCCREVAVLQTARQYSWYVSPGPQGFPQL